MVDAVNITDNQTAVVRMSSWAASLPSWFRTGWSPTFRWSAATATAWPCRATSWASTPWASATCSASPGDHQTFGNHPQAKNVFDIDCMQLIALVKKMRDEGKFLNGEEIDVPPQMFIGAAANPFADPLRVPRLPPGQEDRRRRRLHPDPVHLQHGQASASSWSRPGHGADREGFILAGVTPMKSARHGQYMRSKVPGMDVPDGVINRLQGRRQGQGRPRKASRSPSSRSRSSRR